MRLLLPFMILFAAIPASGCAQDAVVPAEPAKPMMIQDFERPEGSLENNLGLASGDWNMDPTDINNSYTDVDVVEMPDIKGNPGHAVRLSYSVESLEPSQNGFWTKLGGFDASGYDHLEFQVKGDAEKGFTDVFKIELKKPKSAEEPDEKIKGAFRIPVTAEWTTVSIPLNKMTGILNFYDSEVWKNPSIGRKDLDEFVVVFQDRMVSRKTGVIYLDNIRFVATGNPGPTAVDFPPRKIEKTKTKIEGLEFARFLIKRLGGFPAKTVVKKNFPENDREFLMEIARDTWRFFDEIVDQPHALPLDTIQLAPQGDEPVAEGMWVGDYTNVTNIGVYLMVLPSAFNLGFITREEAVERTRKTLTTIEGLEYHKSGFPYNYYDTTTLEGTSYFVSLVDSGWLIAGLYVVKNAFPELAEQAQRLIDRGNLSFFYDPVEQQMFHGFYEHLEVYSDYHYGVFYTEPRATSYIAIAQGVVPKEHWFGGMIRTFPESYSWLTQKPIQRVKKTVLGLPYMAGYYEWKGIRFVPSWGGSAFEALMPALILKEKELAPQGLGLNDARHVEGQIRFALEDTGYPVWGMSPSSIPEGGYSEYGAKPFGSRGYKAGAVTPHASILALEFAPESVVKNLRELIKRYDVYGEYGFYDAVNPETGAVARKYLSLDQGMIFVALNNYLNQGAIRNYFHADPVMKQGEDLLTADIFFEETKAPAA